jgi:glycosyltransferase involved in cell wall biosynthesis
MTRGLAVTTITRNEAANLARCLESVAWAQEIVVLDAESTDRTTEIARRFTSKVFVRRWPGFAAQKNFALTHVTQPWVLSLDADEEVSPELRADIEGVLAADGPLDGYFVPRKNFFLGRWIRHGRWFPDYQLRLFRRGRGAFRPVSVHEGLAVEGRVGYLKAPLLHQSYRGIDDFVERANRYSSLAAQDLVQHERRISAVHLLARPLARFCSMYLVHRGFLDGRHGLLLASLYSYYVFLRYAKAWELGRRDTRSVVDEIGVTPERDMLAK